MIAVSSPRIRANEAVLRQRRHADGARRQRSRPYGLGARSCRGRNGLYWLLGGTLYWLLGGTVAKNRFVGRGVDVDRLQDTAGTGRALSAMGTPHTRRLQPPRGTARAELAAHVPQLQPCVEPRSVSRSRPSRGRERCALHPVAVRTSAE